MKHQITVVIDHKRIGVNAELNKKKKTSNFHFFFLSLKKNELDILEKILEEVSPEYRRQRHREDSFYLLSNGKEIRTGRKSKQENLPIVAD